MQQPESVVTESDFANSVLIPPFKPGYKIFYGTLDFFVLLKRIIMIYERFVIARKHIEEKVREDILNNKLIEIISKELSNSETTTPELVAQNLKNLET